MTYIVADIGGTNARFAVAGADDSPEQVQIFPCADFPRLEDAIRRYLQNTAGGDVTRICLAIAGPVDGDWVDVVNNHWQFSRAGLEASLGISLTVINDFTAQALCLDLLEDDELVWLGEARPSGGQIRAVLGPGSGLGVAALLPGGEIVPSEGGHVAFAPTDHHQLELLQMLWRRYGRVSVERILSGQGLENLYWANSRLQDRENELPDREITARAKAGDSLCRKTIEDFLDIFSSVAGDFALQFWAAGGVYLTGGVLARIWEFSDPERFRHRFEDKGRYRDYCASFPLALVNAEQPGLRGCIAALKNHDWN